MDANKSRRPWGMADEEYKEREKLLRMKRKEEAGTTAILARQGGFFLKVLRKEMLSFTNMVIEEAAYEQCKPSLERYVSVTKKLDDAAEVYFGEDYLSIPKDKKIAKYKWIIQMLAKYVFDDVSGDNKYTLNTQSHWEDLLHQRVEWMFLHKIDMYDPEEFSTDCKRFLPEIVSEIADFHSRRQR